MVGKATTGSSFSGLASYLTQNEERVAWTEPRWMMGTDPKEVAREMEAAATLASSRLEKPVYHVSISFSEADHPTREQMQATADRVLHELGLEKHQAFLVAHQDKDHPHLHVMVNRVHPDTGKVADVAFDYRKIETVLRELEKEWGMTQVPGHHARSAGEDAPDRAQALSTGEVRQARRTGEAPFPQEIRERMGDELNKAIENAKSWNELREALGRHGYRIEPTERGMKITDGERYAKASGVDERLGRFRLEERFGERLTGRTDGEQQVDRIPPSSPPGREEPLEKVRGASSGNEVTKGDIALPGERAAGDAAGRSSVYESLFGKPALERGEATRGGGAGQLLGAAAVAARPVSSEDGEKEVPLRAVEVGLRGAAALTGRSETSRPELVEPDQKQTAEKQPEAETRVSEQSVPERTDVTQPERATGEPSEGKVSPEVGKNPSTDLDQSGPARPSSPDQGASPLPPAPTPDPQVQRLVRDVQTYERAVQAEHGLSAAAGAYAEVELRWKAAQRQGQEVTRLSQTFDRALREAYRDPAAARQAFEALAEQKGPGAAARAMRQEPEKFGAVVEVQQKKWMGLATEVSKAEGYAAARGAANVGEQYLHSRAGLQGAAQPSGLESTVAAKGAEMKALRQELNRIGQPSAILERIGRQARGFTSAQMYQLGRVLTPEQMGVVMKAAGITVRLARGYGR